MKIKLILELNRILSISQSYEQSEYALRYAK